jgi:hypothetical protein
VLHEHLKASWRAEVEAIVRAELSKMEAELARMHHQVEQSFTQLLAQSAARLAAISQEPAIADFAERAFAQVAALSAASAAVSASSKQLSVSETLPPPEAVPAPSPADALPVTPTIDLQALYYYLVEIQSQQTQADILNLLVTRALEYAPRVVLFVVKAGNVVAWTERGFETAGVSLRGLTIPLQANTILFAAVEQQMAVLDSPSAYAENQILLDRIGQPPQAMAAIPLLVRGKAAAVLYADSADQPGERIVLPPLQILTNVAGLTVELLNARNRLATTTVAVTDRATQAMPAPPTTTETSPTATVSAPQVHTVPVTAEQSTTAEAAREARITQDSAAESVATPPPQEITYATEQPEATAVSPEAEQATSAAPSAGVMAEQHLTPQMFSQPDGQFVETPRPDHPVPAAPETVSATAEVEKEAPEPKFEPVSIPPYVPPGPTIYEPTPAIVESSTTSFPTWTPSPPPPSDSAEQSPVFVTTAESSPASTSLPGNGQTFVPLPLGTSPSTQSPPPVSKAVPLTPPKPTTEEEAKAHNDARRFARLLVSEIKLYNEAKVAEGRLNHDLYDRLKEDIDRSRQMYDKRVSPIVAAKFDYFYDELVSSLAEGDPSRLGPDCPGPVLIQPE